MDLVQYIYFEKQQQDNLCAQHALNVLLQGSYFTAVDLAAIGKELDDAEEQVGGRKRGGESQNYDDSGYFSLQVLQKALEIWNLEMIPWRSKEMDEARSEPTQQIAFICNLRNHWFTLRKFAEPFRWYNLDSMQKQPSYLGENYVAMMLHQIECDGYSVFAIKGNLPESEGDRKARAMLRPLGEGIIEGKETPKVVPFSGQGHSMNSTSNEGDTELEKAIQSSIEDQKKKEANDMDEIRRKRLARFGG